MTAVSEQHINTAFTRQLGLYDPAETPNAHVHLVGCGGIGSFAAFGLAKLGVPALSLTDFDTVEIHNVPNQNFTTDQVGKSKVEATQDTILAINPDCTVTAYEMPLQDMPRPHGIVVSGLDSMEARVALWEQHIKFNPKVSLYVDGRLDAEYVVLYAINPLDITDVDQYERTLAKSDDEIEPTLCTERGIIYVGLSVAEGITHLVKQSLKGEKHPRIVVRNLKTWGQMSGDWPGVER